MTAAILPFRSPDRALAARSTDAAIVAGVYQRAIAEVERIRTECEIEHPGQASPLAARDLDAIEAQLDRLLQEATDPASRGAAPGAGANAGEGEGSCSLLPLSLPRRGSFLEV